MVRSSLAKSACVGIALFGICAQPASAVVVHRGATAVGPRGGVYHRGGTWAGHPGYGGGGVYRGGVYRGGAYGYHGGVYRGYGGWARPGGYWWPTGGAIAAGAAIGVLATGAAIAYAGQPPAPGLCWYYTDPSYRQGFWDACQ